MGEKDGGGGRRKSSAKHHWSGSDTRFSHREQAVPFFWGERRESTPTLFSRLGKLFQLSGIKMVAVRFFLFLTNVDAPRRANSRCTRGREGVDRGARSARAGPRYYAFDRLYICLSISRLPQRGWMELQFCGRRQLAGRAQPL